MKLFISALMIVLTASAGTTRAEPAVFTIETFSNIIATARADGTRGNALINAYLDIDDEDHADVICARMPHVRDAITSVFSRHRVRVVKAQIDFADIGDKVRAAVNKALEADLVTGVRLSHGKRTAHQIKDDGRIVTCSDGRAYTRKARKGKRKVEDVFDDKVRSGIKKRSGK